MSGPRRKSLAARAAMFAALGDETRLSLLGKLGGAQERSISELTAGTDLTRQAVTKHLRVLERVRIVHSRREGRESLFAADPGAIQELAKYLERVSTQWDAALGRLKALVEGDGR